MEVDLTNRLVFAFLRNGLKPALEADDSYAQLKRAVYDALDGS